MPRIKITAPLLGTNPRHSMEPVEIEPSKPSTLSPDYIATLLAQIKAESQVLRDTLRQIKAIDSKPDFLIDPLDKLALERLNRISDANIDSHKK